MGNRPWHGLELTRNIVLVAALFPNCGSWLGLLDMGLCLPLWLVAFSPSCRVPLHPPSSPPIASAYLGDWIRGLFVSPSHLSACSNEAMQRAGLFLLLAFSAITPSSGHYCLLIRRRNDLYIKPGKCNLMLAVV